MPERKRLPTSGEAAIAAALHAEARPTTDLAFGPGQHYEVANGQIALEIFPEAHMARITTPTSRLELFDSPPPQIVNGQVVLSRNTGQEETSLSVSPEGTVVFGYVSTAPAAPDLAPEQPVTAPEVIQEPAAAPSAGTGASAVDRTPPEPLSPVPSGAGLSPSAPPQHHADPIRTDHRPDQPKQEHQLRVQLTGRLGRDPSFRTSPRGTLIGRFPLAVHREDGTTVWHSVLAFNDRARQLQHRTEAGELTKGQEVTLVGYPHTRTQPTRNGGSKTVTEIYAVAVTKR